MGHKHRPPGRPRNNESNEPTHLRILQIAKALFLEHGFQKVSIDDIAMASGVTKATVYYYYETKALLFTKSMIAMMERIRGRMLQLLGRDKPLYERLLDVAEAHLKATTSIDLDGFMRETKTSLSPQQVQYIRETEEKMYGEIENALRTAMANGEMKTINPTFAAHSYISLLRVGNYRHSDGTAIFPSDHEAACQIVDLFLKGAE
ncbi:TetR family transcriptional regulator [Scopulibacillus darangshiensis]|uniref:TetR family transcriptional regulator n=1 Tax=Scopulibacillus darangshiensis TaxID=442528 RepID=A0A4R2P4I8_9BACL|nr:TetR/AcrR family transcriptional regulator [Scopulibacillus darangshiensis]TCP29729.1 TetR family transcriptional regulator [Scopulibacillus darangshiensis]